MKSRTKTTSSTSPSLTSPNTKAVSKCDKQYPSISAAYWLPATNPTPYQVPGNILNINQTHQYHHYDVCNNKIDTSFDKYHRILYSLLRIVILLLTLTKVS